MFKMVVFTAILLSSSLSWCSASDEHDLNKQFEYCSDDSRFSIDKEMETGLTTDILFSNFPDLNDIDWDCVNYFMSNGSETTYLDVQFTAIDAPLNTTLDLTASKHPLLTLHRIVYRYLKGIHLNMKGPLITMSYDNFIGFDIENSYLDLYDDLAP